MTKFIFFLPLILFFGFFLLLVIGFFLLIFKLINKQRKDAWIGTVMDKKHNQARDFDTDRLEDYYHLVVKTDDGRELKVGLSPQMFEAYTIGDRIQKPKGKLLPEKV